MSHLAKLHTLTVFLDFFFTAFPMKILLAFIFKAFGHFINRDSERTDKNDMEEMDNRTWNWPKDLYLYFHTSEWSVCTTFPVSGICFLEHKMYNLFSKWICSLCSPSRSDLTTFQPIA